MVEIAAITPEASDEEVAAIVSALELSWPAATGDDAVREEPARWRFSGRWWTKPLPLRRGRPW
jgi:hypothetical protein